MKEQLAFRNGSVNMSKVSYITPESEEIKIRLENTIMSNPEEGGGEGYGEPDQD